MNPSEWLNREVQRQAEKGYILCGLGLNFREYFNAFKPCKRKAVFDPVPNDPTETFNADTLTGRITRYKNKYPVSNATYVELKGLGSEVAVQVGQRVAINYSYDILRPNGAGDRTEFPIQFPDSGEHWDKVDETGLGDDDTTYIESDSYSRRCDLYVIQNPSDYEWRSVAIRIRVRVTAGSAIIYQVLRTHGSEYENWVENITHTTYQAYMFTWYTNPFTEQPWTTQEITDLQAGVRSNRVTDGTLRATQVEVIASYNRYYEYRGFASFNTGAYDWTGKTITSALLKVAMEYDFSATDFDMHFYSGEDQWTGTADLSWNDCAVDEGVFFNTAGKAVDTYYSHSVLASSISKTGRTQFRFKSDREGTKPTGMEYTLLYGAGTAFKPQLEVNYTVPVPPAKPLISKPLVNPQLANVPIVRLLKKRLEFKSLTSPSALVNMRFSHQHKI